MTQSALFWNPNGFELDALGSKKYLRATDGDTPYISVSIRMLSIDTPEVHYPGNAKPARQDDKLKQLADWIAQDKVPIHADLAQHLHARLDTGSAGSLQGTQGEQASDYFKQLVDVRLSRPNSNRKRTTYIHVGDQAFDQYGRLLAYMAPNYSRTERDTMSRLDKATFNLLMIKSGWAASFPIFPSLPKHADMNLMREVGEAACENKLGAWSNPHMLTGYEFRMCVRLYDISSKLQQGKKLSSNEKNAWISRYCVDMTTREIFYPQDYHKVKPYNRVFIWSRDVKQAVAELNLFPAG
ncbi:MAG: thermonuclease family protein [Gammaproteobacteria bacterium]|nr:thermonuclease family protein [Gammaproteobacteria bacterium]